MRLTVLNELNEICRIGLYKNYVKKEENLSFLKGKLISKRQLNNELKKLPKFSCSYQDLTYDNLENQILLRATTLLIPWLNSTKEYAQV